MPNIEYVILMRDEQERARFILYADAIASLFNVKPAGRTMPP